jgi:hypothetical protein
MTNAPIYFATVAQQLAERHWRPFPGIQRSKVPAMRAWNGLNVAPWDSEDLAAAIAEYQPIEAFCCCMAAQQEIVAIDLDIMDPEHAAFAANIADKHLGMTPLMRIGRAPKSLRIYRNGDHIRSCKRHPVEIFSGSGQFISFGWHEEAGRPYQWPHRSPLDLDANSVEIPSVTQFQIEQFIGELFKIVPRRQSSAQHGRSNALASFRSIGDRLRMLTFLHGSWKRAAAIVLREAVEGCRNETGWAVVASAAGRGIPEDVIWRLFERHFTGWAGFSESDLASAIERTRPQLQTSSKTFVLPSNSGGRNVGRR